MKVFAIISVWFVQTVFLCFSIQINAQTIQSQLGDDIDIVVSQQGTGDYTSIQAAINAIPDNNSSRKIIFIKNGIYIEKVIVPITKTNITLIGEDMDSTVLVYNDSPSKDTSLWTFRTYTIRVDADDFWAMNMTFKNSAGDAGQALALFSNGDRQIFTHCRLLGWQDTYYINIRARNYFKDCFIEGAVDYIFGFGLAVFDSCQIHTVRSEGIITAASTPADYKYGLVFRNCNITVAPAQSGISLGRPWFDYGRTVYYKCHETSGLLRTGWTPWEGREATCYYREFKCMGPGSDTTKRISFGKQLTEQESDNYNLDTIFASSAFPADPNHDTSEINTIHRRFVSRNIGHISAYFLEAGRDTFPAYPSVNWKVRVDDDSIYQVIKKNTKMILDSGSGVFLVQNLFYNNIPIPGFDPSKSLYGIELDKAEIVPPIISVSAQDALVNITYPSAIPGYTSVLVTSKNKLSQSIYKVYNSKDSSFWNANLKFITYNSGNDTIYIQPGLYEYNQFLPKGTTSLPNLSPRTSVSGSTYKISMSATFPGTAIISVTAIDTNSTQEYRIHFSSVTAIQNNEAGQNCVLIQNPFDQFIKIMVKLDLPSDIVFDLYDLNGRIILSKKYPVLQNGYTTLTESTEQLSNGNYAYKIVMGDQVLTGKLIKVSN